MNAVQSALNSPRFTRVLFWLGAVVLVVGMVFFLVKVFGGNDSTVSVEDSGQRGNVQLPAAAPTGPKTQLDPQAEHVARVFIVTAVRRKDLARAWTLSHPDLRQGMSRKEWLTGSIPVVPYTHTIAQALFKIDYSYAKEAQLKVALVPKNPKADAAAFDLGLKKVGSGSKAHWLVDYWAPSGTPPNLPNPETKG
jgi:hypothetical protein